MGQDDIEIIYEELANGIDASREGNAEIFLAQACLLLARELGNRDRAVALIRDAARLQQEKSATAPF